MTTPMARERMVKARVKVTERILKVKNAFGELSEIRAGEPLDGVIVGWCDVTKFEQYRMPLSEFIEHAEKF